MFPKVLRVRSLLLTAGVGAALSVPTMVVAQEAAPPRAVQTPPRDAQAVDSRAVGQNQDAQHLTEYFADQLMLANHGEIELAKIAQERSTNNEVKQFAKMLIDDHMQLDAKLKQVAPKAAEKFAERRRVATELGARIARNIRDRVNERAIDRETPTADRVQTRTAAREAGELDAFTRLCQINHAAARNHQELSKQLLEKYQGQDFDMAFLGMQIGAHGWLLSELQALQGVGTPEFQEIVTSATQSVQHHLEQAKALSKKFEDDRRSS
jgi:predicted outer membrane protein